MSRKEFLEDFLKLAGASVVRSYAPHQPQALPEPKTTSVLNQDSACFFPETNFWVKNQNTINFLTGFENLGSITSLGYPISRPFESESFLHQAFQRGLLQWRPDYNPPQVVLDNVMDMLYKNNQDDLLTFKGIPRHIPGNFSGIERLLWLTNPQIRDFYFQNKGSSFFGFPTSKPEQSGPFIAQRFQRQTLQLWLENVKGMPFPGTVVPALVGYLVRDAGLIPQIALKEEQPPFIEKEIKLPLIVRNGDRTKPNIALTMDDAWSKDQVNKAFEIIRRLNVQMTFFPVGSVIAGEAEYWRQAIADGHEIGNHTFSHADLPSLSDQGINDQINKSQDALDKALGFHYPMRFLRPPGGAGGYDKGDERLLKIVSEHGLTIAMWSIDPLNATSMYDHVTSRITNGDIVLFHFNTPDIRDLERIIQNIKGRGFVLSTLSGLFGKSPILYNINK